MFHNQKFSSNLATELPETYELFMEGNLVVHPAVVKVNLAGSHGLAGGFRPDSDIDLSLIVNITRKHDDTALSDFLQIVLETSLKH